MRSSPIFGTGRLCPIVLVTTAISAFASAFTAASNCPQKKSPLKVAGMPYLIAYNCRTDGIRGVRTRETDNERIYGGSVQLQCAAARQGPELIHR